MLAYLVSDLMWDSRISAAARASGVPARRVRSWDEARALLETGGVRLVLIDLTDPAGDEIVAQTPAIADFGARVTAFGPHVETAALDRARACGAEVVPRGALSRRLDEIMGTLAGG